MSNSKTCGCDSLGKCLLHIYEAPKSDQEKIEAACDCGAEQFQVCDICQGVSRDQNPPVSEIAEGSKDPWFRALYTLAYDGKLSINQLFEEFKKKISKINGEDNRPYFYTAEWPWGKELDGQYIKYETHKAELQKKDAEIAELKSTVGELVSKVNSRTQAKYEAQGELKEQSEKVAELVRAATKLARDSYALTREESVHLFESNRIDFEQALAKFKDGAK